MRNIVPVVAAVMVWGAAAAQAQPESAWRVRGDNGELVHVLPGPAAAEAWEHRFGIQPPPTSINGYSVYSASFGAVPGQLDDHGGAVVANAAYQPIFYNSATAAVLQAGIDNMVDNFSNSDPGMKVITQYSKGGYTISPSLTHVADFVDEQPAPRRISDSQVQKYLANLFSSNRVIANGFTIYGVYLPQGTQSTLGQYRACVNYCAYHSHFSYNGQTILYAVYPFDDCGNCTPGGKTVLDVETIVTSHEIREAITDPVDAWWESASGYEADDKCAWRNLYQLTGGAWVQPEYSNGLAGWPRGCVCP